MARESAFAIMLVLLAGVVVAKAEKQDVRVTGWVSDESCGAEHRKPGGEDCVKMCIKGAPHLNPEWTAQRMVFVTDGEPALWVVENPEALEGYEGKHVRISGQLDSGQSHRASLQDDAYRQGESSSIDLARRRESHSSSR